MASHAAAGSTRNGRDSPGKRLGVKLSNGQEAKVGCIIIRQNGFSFYPGKNVFVAKNYSIHAAIDGIVIFRKQGSKTIVNVVAE